MFLWKIHLFKMPALLAGAGRWVLEVGESVLSRRVKSIFSHSLVRRSSLRSEYESFPEVVMRLFWLLMVLMGWNGGWEPWLAQAGPVSWYKSQSLNYGLTPETADGTASPGASQAGPMPPLKVCFLSLHQYLWIVPCSAPGGGDPA